MLSFPIKCVMTNGKLDFGKKRQVWKKNKQSTFSGLYRKDG